jgi:hypothetical protein
MPTFSEKEIKILESIGIALNGQDVEEIYKVFTAYFMSVVKEKKETTDLIRLNLKLSLMRKGE